MKKTKDNISTDNYYYVQVFTDIVEKANSPFRTHFYTVAFAPSKEKAIKIIHEWLTEKGVAKNDRRDIHLYLKNYKIESRKMVESGNYIVAN